jgi:hypothetical protein
MTAVQGLNVNVASVVLVSRFGKSAMLLSQISDNQNYAINFFSKVVNFVQSIVKKLFKLFKI